MAEKALKLPTTIGGCVDLLYKLRQARIEQQKRADAIKAQETALEEYIFSNYKSQGIDGVRGKVAMVSIKELTVPTVVDWDKFYAYIARNKAWELLQKRPGAEACRERWALGKAIPGVEQFRKLNLSVTKR